MIVWLAVRAFMGRAVTGALRVLGSLNAWQILCLCCLAIAGLQTLKLHAEQRHSAKVEAQLAGCAKAKQGLQDTLDSISTAKNEQQVVTREKLKVVTRTIHEKELIAQKIEQAPDEPQCRTPQAIMGADL